MILEFGIADGAMRLLDSRGHRQYTSKSYEREAVSTSRILKLPL
jgi:hypothetical protein